MVMEVYLRFTSTRTVDDPVEACGSGPFTTARSFVSAPTWTSRYQPFGIGRFLIKGFRMYSSMPGSQKLLTFTDSAAGDSPRPSLVGAATAHHGNWGLE